MSSILLHTIKMQSEFFPDKPCIHYSGESYIYRELWYKIEQTMRVLHSNGINNTSRVYLSGNNSIDLIVLFFSLLGIGADVVLTDPKSTEKEIRDLLVALPTDFLLLEENAFADTFPGAKIFVAHALSYKFIPLNNYAQNKHAAVTFFSTGTTGQPKAFTFSEDKLMQQLLNLAAHLSLIDTDSVLCPVSFTHSHGVMMSLPFLLLGATVHYLHPKECKPAIMMPYIEQNGITVFTGVPTQYNFMLEEDANPDALRSLRYAFCGSAPMTEFLAINFLQKFGVGINQAYGISEIGPICINLLEEGNTNLGSIGKVIRNIEYKIVDEQDEEVKKGEEGELLVRSSFMTEGYVNVPGEHLFRNGWMCTQDIVREDEQGNIYIVGRKTEFINVSGYKVFPVEVEKVLLSMKGIRDAVVVGEAHASRTQSIKAYVSTFFPLEVSEIKEYCRKHLSKYKIPHDIIIMDELPTNSIGKVIAGKLKNK